MKKFLFWLLLIAILLCSVELLSWPAVLYLKNKKQRTYAPLADRSLSEEQRQAITKLLKGEFEYSDFDPDLGWSIKPNGQKGYLRANSQKMRSDREYSKNPDEGVLLINAYDDIEREQLREYFAPKKHYSPKGNKLCAKKVLEYLTIKGYINGNFAAGSLP